MFFQDLFYIIMRHLRSTPVRSLPPTSFLTFDGEVRYRGFQSGELLIFPKIPNPGGGKKFRRIRKHFVSVQPQTKRLWDLCTKYVRGFHNELCTTKYVEKIKKLRWSFVHNLFFLQFFLFWPFTDYSTITISVVHFLIFRTISVHSVQFTPPPAVLERGR